MAATARILTVAVVEERPVLRAVDPGVLAEHKQLEALGERLVVPTAPQVLSTWVVEVMTRAVAEVVATTAAEVPETTVVAAVANPRMPGAQADPVVVPDRTARLRPVQPRRDTKVVTVTQRRHAHLRVVVAAPEASA